MTPVRRAVTMLAAACLAPTVAPVAVSAQDASRPQLRGQRLDPDGAVRIWNLVGAVRVIGWAHDSIAVSARVGAGGQLFFGGGHRGVKVGVEERDGSAASAELEVHVPRGAKVWVKSSTANVTVSGLTSDVEVYSVSGAVRVAGRPSTLRVESLAGPVTVSDGAAWLRARTSSGALTVRGAVDDAALSTVGGALSLHGTVAQRARLESVTGTVEHRGDVARGATLAIESNSGDVALRLARDDSALDLLTLNGRITSRLPSVRAAVRAQGAGQAAQTTAPAGAGRIEVRTFRGAVAVDGARSKGLPE